MTAQQSTLVIEGLARLAKTWGGHAVRSEPEEGDEGGDAGELVPGRELRVTELPIDEAQFDSLVGAGAWNSFFNCEAGKLPQRAFESFSRIKLDDKYKNCEVELVFGVTNQAVSIAAAMIKNIGVKFGKTSKPELSCTIVGARPRTLDTLDLEDFGGKPVNVSLSFGPVSRETTEQQQLPLAQASADGASPEQPHPDPDATNGAEEPKPAKRETQRRSRKNADHALAH